MPLLTRREIKDLLRKGSTGNILDSVFFVGKLLSCKYVLSDWTLYVALSRSCPYCMRCSEWKRGLKRRCILSRSSQAFFCPHPRHTFLSHQHPSRGPFLMLLFLCVVQGSWDLKCCSSCTLSFPPFSSDFLSSTLLCSPLLSTLSEQI